uniref:DIRP domain-containing protein n=1 Tax=Caenorhabditis tropicalis TaxID=1561998 RepID=A0A1I7U632_9PELO
MSTSGRSPRKKVASDTSDPDRNSSPYSLRGEAKLPSRYRNEEVYSSPTRNKRTASPKKSPAKRLNGGRDSPAVNTLVRNSSLTMLAKTALDYEASSCSLEYMPKEEPPEPRRLPRRALALTPPPPMSHDLLAKDLQMIEMHQNLVAGLDDLDNPANMTNEAVEHRDTQTFFNMFSSDQERSAMMKQFKTFTNQTNEDVTTFMRANIKKLYNLLRYKKARQWVMCEFFYSAIDEQIFKAENEFATILRESFPNLKNWNLTRVEWRTIRKMLGKPRRCSNVFFEEERMYLEEKRTKIRSVYEGSYLNNPAIDLKDLPAKLPRQMVVGNRVFARIRHPYDGIYSGEIDALIPKGFRIIFDKPDIAPTLVSDTEVLLDGKTDLLSIAYFIEEANSKLPTGVRPFVAPTRDPNRPHTIRDELVTRRMDKGGPLAGLDDDRLNAKSAEMVGNFPLKFLVNLVKLTKLIEIKKTLIKQLQELNSEAEMMNMTSDSYPLTFQEKYAKTVIDLEHVNQNIDINMNGIQDHHMYFSSNDMSVTNMKPEAVRKVCYQQAGRFVEGCNQGLNVENVHALTLIQALTAVLLQHEDMIASSAESSGIGEVLSADEEELSARFSDAMSPLKLQLRFVAGVIQRERLPAFERLLWRACRGNVFLRTSEIDDVLNDTVTGDPVNKCVFIIFFQGDQLKTKVKKICEGFRATLYPCPDTPQERREMSIGVMTRIEDLKTVLGQTQDHRHRVLVAASKNVRMWLTKVRKIKSIYHTLNLFNIDVTQKCLIAEVWCPIAELDRIKMALKRGTDESGSQVPSILNRMETHEAPPTYNKTNKFTKGFQNIVDAYGIATYREINPAPYTMISFPFLFAVMFGDMGHGAIMLLAALFFILKEKQLEAARIKDEIFQTFFGGRYVIFLMGVFSIYTGFMYNDVFSKSLNSFGSSWRNSIPESVIDSYLEREKGAEAQLMLVPELAFDGNPYPIGVDPVWNLAEGNKLSFLNSMKMKMSVLFGITQMTFGVLLSYQNYIYFKSDLDIKYMFIPQMIFLSSIFIYLCIQIVAKWLFFGATAGTVLGYTYPSSNCAPSLLIGLINMFMMKGRNAGFVDEQGNPYSQCWLSTWYPGQATIEIVLVVLAVIQIPIMLFAKPFFLRQRERRAQTTNYSSLENQNTNQYHMESSLPGQSVRADISQDDAEVVHAPEQTPKPAGHGHGHGDGPLDMADVMVYQAIHTIEFVLGCVSHTASYLRLWALSLAHAQLSDVLWTMVFRNAFVLDGYAGAVATYVLFFIFGSLSVFILVLMEGLSAFLHALRLHWVEFQSKFYGGLGHEFAPFSFEKILAEEREAEENL